MATYYVSSGRVSNGIILNRYDSMYVYYSGTANRTIVDGDPWSFGMMCISSGGTANYTTINHWGDLFVYGGVANSTTVNSGRMIVYSGGVANHTTQNGGDELRVSYGGTANYTTVNSEGDLRIFSGGTANYTTVNAAEGMYTGVEVYHGGVANHTTVNSGPLDVRSGGVANSVTVNSGGGLYVQSGGTALNVVWTPCVGNVYVYDGATVTFVSKYKGVYFGSGGKLLSSATTMTGKVLAGGGSSYYYDTMSMYVMNGGVANETTVNSGGHIEIWSGGVANYTTVNAAGGMYTGVEVYHGGVANHTTVNSGPLDVRSGGVANSTTVNSGGYLYVSSGGTASLVFDPWQTGGVVYVYEGGTLLYLAPDAGVYYGSGSTTSKGNNFSGLNLTDGYSAFVYSGGTANRTAVNSGGGLYVSSGGTANRLTVNAGGEVSVDAGGTAYSITINEGGAAIVSAGGTASAVTVNRDGTLYVYSGGTALDVGWKPFIGSVTVCEGAFVTFADAEGVFLGSEGTLVSSAPALNDLTLAKYSMYVMNGGVATNVSFTEGGIYVSSGGTVDSATLNGGLIHIYAGGAATSAAVNASGKVCVSSGGVANSVTVNFSGCLHVYSSGAANDLTTYDHGSAYVDAGGTLDRVTMHGGDLYVSGVAAEIAMYGGWLNISGGGVSSVTLYNDRGGINIYGGGVLTAADIRGGALTIHSGGSLRGAAAVAGGNVCVSLGGAVESVAVEGGELCVSSGGEAGSAAVANGNLYVYGTVGSAAVANGNLYVYGTVNDTTVASGGVMRIQSVAGSTTVDDGGKVYVDGTADLMTVNSGGSMMIGRDGKVKGRLTIADGAYVYAESGSVFSFDISDVSPGAATRLNGIALIRGMPEFTVTVSATQRAGSYKLAGGAVGFDREMVVNDTVGFTLGTIRVGGTLVDEDRTYRLFNDGGTLTLTVDDGVTPLPVAITPGDLNGDGRADIVMTITQAGHGAEGATGAWLIHGDQTAAWGDLSQRNAGWSIFGTGVTSAGKTTNDVYVKSTGNVVGAWVTDETGKVAGWETVGEFDATTNVLGLGDFNGDGQTDLLLRNDNGAVGCFFTSGDKTGWNYFQSLGDEWTVSAVGDLNGDGRDDVVLKHDAGFAGSWLTQADGTMAWANLDTLADGFTIVGCGDFDGDGTSDVLLKNGNYYGAWIVENGSVKSWMGLGDLGDVTVEQIADFDGDGIDDLRIRTAAGDLGAQLVKGADTLDWHYYGSVGSEWSTLDFQKISLAAI